MARHQFFTLSPEILCAIDHGGHFKRVNPAFTETLGYENDALAKTSLLELVEDDDRSALRAELASLIDAGVAREFEFRFVCANGHHKWLAWRAKYDPKNGCIYAAARDTTEQKRVEEQLRRYNRELQQLSLEAQAATRAKSEFIANVSHELRTPLTAVLMVTEILKSGLSDPEQLSAVATIERNSQYLLTLISELLDLSKIEAGKLAIEPVVCHTARFFQDLETALAPRAREKGLDFAIDIQAPFPETVQTDPTRLQQILFNLVDNAIKFTERGAVKIRFRVEQTNSVQLVAEIVDTGIGMTRWQLNHLFEPFTQGDASTSRRFGGTGLGLAISRRLARMLGGDITVTSEAGVGSTFTVRVDVGLSAATGRAPAIPKGGARFNPPGKATFPEQPLAGVRILFAEDYPDIQRPVAYVLEKWGAAVTLADNGRQAIDLALAAEASEEPFSIILMDMQMPLVDGYSATRELRKAGCQRPVIALTAHAMESDRRKCLSCGCNDYLAKPINTPQLAALILHHVHGVSAAEVAKSDRLLPHSEEASRLLSQLLLSANS
jgi:PAS domain S-box-containing protein